MIALTLTISLHGWDWVWLIVGIALAAFLWGFFSAFAESIWRAGRR